MDSFAPGHVVYVKVVPVTSRPVTVISWDALFPDTRLQFAEVFFYVKRSMRIMYETFYTKHDTFYLNKDWIFKIF